MCVRRYKSLTHFNPDALRKTEGYTMPTTRSSKNRMNEAVSKALADGDSFLANEITANVMVGTTMMIVFAVTVLCLVLNEAGVFTADKAIMRWAVVASVVVELPMTVINTIYVGTKKWLKVPLMIDLILVCAILAAALGHNVTLVMCFPIVVSSRYFDRKYTRNVALLTAGVFALSSILNGFVGIANLNMVKFPDGAQLLIQPGQSLRDAVIAAGMDKMVYIKS